MLLVSDIGNTNITLGVFEGDKLLETFRLESDKDLSQKDYEFLLETILKKYEITNCIIGSVVTELTNVLKNSVDKVFNIQSFVLNSDMHLGIKLKLENPQEVGVDRIANACAAFSLCKKAVIVVDLGTATTLEVVNSCGEFLGGVIMPGINMQFSILNKSTSLLPKIGYDNVHTVIGNNTNDAILSGVIKGTACSVEQLLQECEKELGEKANIVVTGGFAPLIAKHSTREFNYINQNLTLEGLRIIFELNNVNK